MKVSDVMTFGVASVSPETVLAEAARTLLDHRISGLPVVDSAGKLVGMLTDGDLVRTVAENSTTTGNHGADTEQRMRSLASVSVREVMACKVRAVDREMPLEEAIHLMGRQEFRALPVVSSGQVVGMLSRPDLIRHLFNV